jgi:hypothetical protein
MRYFQQIISSEMMKKGMIYYGILTLAGALFSYGVLTGIIFSRFIQWNPVPMVIVK